MFTNVTYNVYKLYWIRFFHHLIPAYVIERLFWEQRGMTVQMVVYVEIVYAVTILLLELPTGILADKWNRKKMLLIDGVAGCLEFLILLQATAFWHFALAVAIAGIGRSASSGAENALLYDTLRLQGKEHAFEKTLGRLNACDIAATVLAALAGSLLANRFGFELNYWISVGAAVVSLVLTLTLVEPSKPADVSGEETNSPSERTSVKHFVTASIRFFVGHPGVCLVLLAGMVTGAAMSFVYEFWQLYLEELRIPVVYFGMFSTALFILGMPGNLVAYRLKNRFRYRHMVVIVTAAVAGGLLLVAAFPGAAGLVAMMIACLAAAILEPLSAGYLHHRISDDSMRATIDSFQSFGLNVVLMASGLGFGFATSSFGLIGGFGFLAAVCGAFVALLFAWRRKIEG